MIPSLALVRIENPDWCRRSLRLWIPLFLLWIPVLLLSPLLVLLMAAPCLVFGINAWTAMRTFWGIVCGLPGTQVRVCAEGKRVHVRIL